MSFPTLPSSIFRDCNSHVETHRNVTSLNSELLTNLGSMRDPFTGCMREPSLMGLMGSQPKHVLKISASSKVVPSFCEYHRNVSVTYNDRKSKKREQSKKKIKLSFVIQFQFFLS